MFSVSRSPLSHLLLALMSVLLAAGCATPAHPTIVAGSTTSPASATNPAPVTMHTTFAKTLTTAAPTYIQTQPVPVSTSTLEPDPRPGAEDWRTWDVLPWVSQRAVVIYKRGLALGNAPHAFSVVGDCQAIQEVFLGLYESQALYHLDASNRHLQKTIDQYDGSFGRAGYAVRGGYSAASILSPLQADPEGCLPGETPLACEFRHHNPSILIISLEVWFDPASVDRYEDYLRAILDLAIERGTLPILINKADMNEGDQHVINPVLARLAREYQLPLVNFWRAAQSLPNFGIDSQREGFHLSEEGYWMKSLVGLQSLDLFWRTVQGEQAMLPFQPTPTLVETQQPTLEVGAAFPPLCGKKAADHPGCAVFDLVSSQNGSLTPTGIQTIDLATGVAHAWAPADFRLQDASPDRSALLVSQAGALFLVQTASGDSEILTSQLAPTDEAAAVFLGGGGDLAWIETAPGGATVHIRGVSGDSVSITPRAGISVRLLPAYNADRLAMEMRQDCDEVDCPSLGIWVLNLSSSEETHLTGVLNPVFSPDQTHFAFMDEIYQPRSESAFNDRLLVEVMDQPLVSRRLFRFQDANGYMSRNRLEGYLWSPDGTWLLVWMDEYSNYYERSSGIRTYLIKMSTGMTWEYERVVGWMPRAAWSADGTVLWLAWMNYDPAGGSTIRFHHIDRERREESDLPAQPALMLPGYQYLGRMFWLPASVD